LIEMSGADSSGAKSSKPLEALAAGAAPNAFAFTFGGSTISGATAAPLAAFGQQQASSGHSMAANGEDEGDDNPEAENSTEYTPVIKLAEQSVPSGEEDDEVVYKQRAALFRFIPESKVWKERGRGDVKLMKNKKTGVMRLLMRQEKTLKIATNQIVHPEMELRVNAGSDRSWVWRARDFSDEKATDETLAIRFKDSDTANEYKQAYDDARKNNETALKVKADHVHAPDATAASADSGKSS